MEKILKGFLEYLEDDGMTRNTIEGYVKNVELYLKWFQETKDMEFTKLHRENVREYISYLKNLKKYKPKTINTKINALSKFNDYLLEEEIQMDYVIMNKDFMKIQEPYASLSKFKVKDIEKFRQIVLESGSKRNYALVTLLAYAGLRISEALDIQMKDVNFSTREIIVRGKGEKTRIVFMNDKVKEALQSYLNERAGTEQSYIFVSNRRKRLNRTTINKLFKKYSDELGYTITPHDLRHFFCSHALESGLSVHEVANQAGHSNIHTTLLYAHPNRDELIKKMNKL